MTFSRHDLAAVADMLREAARVEILPRFRRLGDGAIRQKTSALDLVTDADEAAERHIAAALRQRFPGAVIVGEEGTALDPSLPDRIAGADLAFVLDPVDGTKNFASGLPLYAVMAAAIVRGEIVGGLIYDPMSDDMAAALRGEGAWTEAADGRQSGLTVAAGAPLEEMNGAISLTWMDEPEKSIVSANLPRARAVFGYRCAGHEYRLAAAGHCHFLIFNKLMPWDHAPGWLIHREAGGYSARFDGSAYLPTQTSGGLIAAPDEASWHAVRDGLFVRRPAPDVPDSGV